MPKALLLENIHPDAAQSLRDHGFEVECLKGACLLYTSDAADE